MLPYLAISALVCTFFTHAATHTITISPDEMRAIGTAIWHNESGCSQEKLTWWHENEEFPSMGIGHFIWHPQGTTSNFGQMFPALLVFLENNNVTLPSWLKATAHQCPWPDRAAFYAQIKSRRMVELRKLLASTVELQTQFIIKRVVDVLPKILAYAPQEDHNQIKKQFFYVATSPMGMYALIDYLNFKGEGINLKESYNGRGWGLLQVLMAMNAQQSGSPALESFAGAAKKVLTQRVENAPPERNEQRWIPGWFNRIDTYTTARK